MIFTDTKDVLELIAKHEKTMDYQWREGSPYSKHNPQVVGEHLVSLARERNGVITTEELVTDSDNPHSPLYSMVERDIEKAAYKYRLSEVRTIAKSVTVARVVTEPQDNAEVVYKLPVMTHSQTMGGYIPTFVTATVTDLRAEEIENLNRQAKSWRNRARAFKQYSTIVNAIDEALGD